jgi:malonyl-CoA/methylmalonyl-CoA synthetase
LTGDTASYEDGAYRILGRTSVDIIKSGGYKISALDIERHLLEHPMIAEVAVVGIPDITWGQKVAAIVLLRQQEKNASLSLEDLRQWSKDRLPAYQVPTVLRVVNNIPRNALGKVNKKELVADLFPKEVRQS